MHRLILLLVVSFTVNKVFAQNVGIGTGTPDSRLQVNNNTSSTTPNTLSLIDSSANGIGQLYFRNIANSRGMKISGFTTSNYSADQYMDIRSDSLFIMSLRGNGLVGIGNINPSYKLDINGDINTTGAIRINGNSGTTGQILTSSGNAVPTWSNAAFGNNTRFSFNFTNGSGTSCNSFQTDSSTFITTYYNTNTTNVSISATNSRRIQINKTGLYHFEVYQYYEATLTTATSVPTNIQSNFFVNNRQYSLFANKQLTNTFPLPTTQFGLGEKSEIDIYISAPATIKLERYFNYAAGSFCYSGYLNGYLISE